MKKFTIPGQKKVETPSAIEMERMRILRPYVRQSGDDMRKPWFLKMRRLLDYLLVYIPEGKGVFTVGDETFDVGNGDVIWIPPNTLHEMRGISAEMRCLYIHFDLIYEPERSHWDALIPGGATEMTGCTEKIHPPVKDPVISKWKGKLNIPNSAFLLPLMRRIYTEHRLMPHIENKDMLLSGMMLELIYGLLHSARNSGEKPEPYSLKMRDAARMLLEQKEWKINIRTLSERFGLSKSHFRRLFRETHGQSPREMHIRAQISRACEMLSYTNMNISEVSAKLAFETVHSFSRAFKKRTGLSPLNYRHGKIQPG